MRVYKVWQSTTDFQNHFGLPTCTHSHRNNTFTHKKHTHGLKHTHRHRCMHMHSHIPPPHTHTHTVTDQTSSSLRSEQISQSLPVTDRWCCFIKCTRPPTKHCSLHFCKRLELCLNQRKFQQFFKWSLLTLLLVIYINLRAVHNFLLSEVTQNSSFFRPQTFLSWAMTRNFPASGATETLLTSALTQTFLSSAGTQTFLTSAGPSWLQNWLKPSWLQQGLKPSWLQQGLKPSWLQQGLKPSWL